MLRAFFTVLWTVFVVVLYSGPFYDVRAADSIPPDISNVQIEEVSETSVTITWETDEEADSLINYGLQEDYGIIRVPGTDKILHSMTLDSLEPGRTYHFRVVSSDEDGNQGISADYKVQTEGQPQVGAEAGEGKESQTETEQTVQSETDSQTESESQSQSQTTQEIIEQIKQIQSAEVLQEIVNETVKAIQGITEDLTIVGPPTVIAETTSARVLWTTDRPADSVVLFSPANSYTPGQYQFSQASTQGATSDHEIQIIGLEPYTEYHFKVQSTDSYGIEGESKDYTFRTKAVLPNIRNLRIVKVEEDSATLAWDTTVPAKALIEYQDLTKGTQNSVGRPTLASTHQMKISNLTLGTRYVAFVIAENAGGDRVKSNPITFVTVKDVAPPIISNVTNESTLFPGSVARIQTIVEWNTDEPALCTMMYREGITGGIEPEVLESDDMSYTERHVEVITDFAPATVYQFWLSCADESGNAVDSENFVLFTPIQEKSIIDIIIENFENTFGWVKNIGG
ncbi:fibronectin type III domain-containing protein [bacterium]|nr:fibronectin type III domain-containing protein [bacterium]